MTADFDFPGSGLQHDHRGRSLQRRQVLQLGLLMGLGGLAGCARAVAPTLVAAPESLPLLWRRQLAKPWRFSPLESAQDIEGRLPDPTALLAVSDGWLSSLPASALQPLGAPSLRARLNAPAVRFLEGFPTELAAALLPVSVSPWVLVFRGDEHVRAAEKQGWSVLLDPSLSGQVVLPASARLLISLADRIDRPDALSRLRSAARVFDDRHGLNWLLQGKAKVAVLPLVRCMASLRSDPRTRAVLPTEGAPLHWTCLARPAQTREPLPQAWIEAAWSMPLMGRLLAEGWVPPLPATDLARGRSSVPSRLRGLVLPSQEILERCWSFGSLSESERLQLTARWDASSP